MPVTPYSPMGKPEKHVSQDRMREILDRNTKGHARELWPKASQAEKEIAAPPRSQGPLQWEKPEPGSMGRYTTDHWYSCCKIGQPDGSFRYEVWTRQPLTSGMTQLAVNLRDFETAKRIAQEDADKHR